MYLLKQFIKYDTIRRTLTLNIYEEYGELEAGEHEFAWSFIVPSNTAVSAVITPVHVHCS